VSQRAEIVAPTNGRVSGTSLSDFEAAYRANVASITAYFARRHREPQEVADLVSETFVEAIGSFGGFDPRRGTTRAWVFGIAHHVHARACARAANGREAERRLAGQRPLEDDEIEELAAKIDAQREGRELLHRYRVLPALEREAIELVDLAGLRPREAATALGVSPSALRVRLFRARTRLRKERDDDRRL
jgi:RNA polymerase sigma-70 factor (ECF subfamily)